MPKGKLIGSAPSKEILAEAIGSHYYWKEPAVLLEREDGLYNIHYPESSPRAGMVMENHQVRVKDGRWRFERKDAIKRKLGR